MKGQLLDFWWGYGWFQKRISCRLISRGEKTLQGNTCQTMALYASPRILLSFARCTYSAPFLNARHNNWINKLSESQLNADYSRKNRSLSIKQFDEWSVNVNCNVNCKSLGVKVSNCTLIKGGPWEKIYHQGFEKKFLPKPNYQYPPQKSNGRPQWRNDTDFSPFCTVASGIVFPPFPLSCYLVVVILLKVYSALCDAARPVHRAPL